MARYEVMKGIVNGQLRKPDGTGPATEIYKFTKGEVFESKDFPRMSDQAIEHLVKRGDITKTTRPVTDKAKGQIEREERTTTRR